MRQCLKKGLICHRPKTMTLTVDSEKVEVCAMCAVHCAGEQHFLPTHLGQCSPNEPKTEPSSTAHLKSEDVARVLGAEPATKEDLRRFLRYR